MNFLIQHSEKFQAIILMFSMSIGIRILLQVVGQRWIVTTAHTATLVLLPILTYTITSVIAGNIALSLGMVGALSIVRFRNPVRSPLELSVYFGAITMGIAASVSPIWVLFLTGSVGLATIGLVVIHFLSLKLFKTPFFSASFSEGNSFSTLEVTASRRIALLDNNKLLTFKRKNKNTIQYVISSSRFVELNNIADEFEGDDSIESYQLTK